MESPCVKTCLIDPKIRLCVGCFRTLDEIASWTKLTPEERRSVMAALPERAAQVGRAAPSGRGD